MRQPLPRPPLGLPTDSLLACGRDADTVCYVVSLALSVCLLVWVSIEADYPLGNDAVKFWVFVLLDSVLTLFVLPAVYSWLGGMAADEDEEDELPVGDLEEAEA